MGRMGGGGGGERKKGGGGGIILTLPLYLVWGGTMEVCGDTEGGVSREGWGGGGGGRGEGAGGESREGRRVKGREGVEKGWEGLVWWWGGGGGGFPAHDSPLFLWTGGKVSTSNPKEIIDGKPTAGESGGRRERKKERKREAGRVPPGLKQRCRTRGDDNVPEELR